MTTKILNTEDFEWVKIKTTNKNGKTIAQRVRVSFTKEQECVEIIAKFKGEEYTFYTPVTEIKDFEREPAMYTAILYNEDGTRAMGVWRHGLTGEKRHIEPICYNLADKCIKAVADYNWGMIRNNHKYLLKIIG